jgi:hypothetical protein
MKGLVEKHGRSVIEMRRHGLYVFGQQFQYFTLLFFVSNAIKRLQNEIIASQ